MNKNFGKKRVAVAFPRERKNEKFFEKIESSGMAKILEIPLSETKKTAAGTTISADEPAEIAAEILSSFGEYEWILFAGTRAVSAFFQRFFAKFKDIRSIGPCKIACLGVETAAAISAFHLEVDAVESASGAALAEKLIAEEGVENLKICVVPAASLDAKISEILEKNGRAIVDVFPIFSGHGNDIFTNSAVSEFREFGADFLVFSSAEAAENFVSNARNFSLQDGARRPRVVALGNAAERELKRLGVPVEFSFLDFSSAEKSRFWE